MLGKYGGLLHKAHSGAACSSQCERQLPACPLHAQCDSEDRSQVEAAGHPAHG